MWSSHLTKKSGGPLRLSRAAGLSGNRSVMTDRGTDLDRASLAPEWQKAFAWVESTVGGCIVRARRQERWRPAWFLDVESEGQTIPLYFRGDRGEVGSGVYPLEHEVAVFGVLEAEGLLVPHVYGLCPEPRGMLMDALPGRPDLSTNENAADRASVLEHLMDLYAELHAIDPKRFEEIGVDRPAPDEIPLGDFARWESGYRARKTVPEPLIEFGIRWVHRNLPDRTQLACLHADAGNFIFDGPRVTALLDFELACLGDPLADLGALRARDLSEPLGDLRPGLRHYVKKTGQEIDAAALDFYTIRFGLQTPMAVAAVVRTCPKGTNLAQFLGWYLVYGRVPCELIADRAGVSVEPPALPEPTATSRSGAHDFLVEVLGGDGRGETYETDVALRVAQYLRRAELYGPQLESEDLDDVAEILGRRPESWREADEALEAFVADAPPALDGPLARYFVRRCLREESLLAPAMREIEGAQVQRLA